MTHNSPTTPPPSDPRQTPADRNAPTMAVPGAVIEGAGVMIGPYKLLQKLGEGGMGQVWVADQEEPVKRRVALKVIKTGMDTEQVIARFEAERQALAMMDHTNIARVLDAGQTGSGRPYFVMELVKGVPITTYCDELHLTLRERLKLFIPVCQAIQHAHQKGIIHRDIKPSNVLVCMQDGQPVPKVIDFGLAKALGQKLSRHTMVTEFGAIVGTLEYMSPEQAELSALDIDTRADVYALGVMLYELLVGSTPISSKQLKKAAFDEVLRSIRELEPQRPSTRLSESKDTIAEVAALRKTEPVRLAHDLKGDLDWIVMKCLEKDRTRRYDAAAGLARDVQRFLSDEPIEARPPSLIYQTQKFVRKNRVGITIAASFLLLLLTATVVSSWQAYRATLAERAAKENEAKALASEQRARKQQKLAEENEAKAIKNEREAVASRRAEAKAQQGERKALMDQLQSLVSEKASREQTYALAEALETIFDTSNLDGDASEILPRLKEKVQQVATTVEKAEDADPMLRGRLRQALGSMLLAFDDYDGAIREYEKAAQAQEKQTSPESPETLKARNRLGLAQLTAKRREDAKKTFEEIYAIRLRLHGPEHADTIVSLHNLAWYDQQTGDFASAINRYEQVIELVAKTKGADAIEMADSLEQLSICQRESGSMLKAVHSAEKVVALREKVQGPEDSSTLRAKYHLGWACGLAGDAEKALQIYSQMVETRRRINGPIHWRTLEAMSDVAWSYSLKRDYPQAIAKYEEVLQKRREVFGMDDPKTLATQGFLARTHDLAGEYTVALPIYADLCERMRKTLGPDAVETWNAENDYAYCADHAGQSDLASKLYEGVLSSKRKKLPPEDPLITVAINNLGNHYFDTNQFDKALPLYEEAFQKDQKRYGLDHRDTLVVMNNLGMTYSRLGRHEEAIKSIGEALRRQLALNGPRHDRVISGRTALADAYQASRNLKTSLQLNEEIAKDMESYFGPESKDALSRWRIVRWQRASLGDQKGALEVALKVYAQAEKRLGAHDNQTMIDLGYIADYREALGEFAAAEPLRKAGLEHSKTLPTAIFMVPISKTSLAKNLVQQKKFSQAQPLLEEVLDFYRKTLPGNAAEPSISSLLAQCYVELGNLKEAEKLLLTCAPALEQANSLEAPAALNLVADLYTRLKKPAEAEAWKARAEAASKKLSSPPPVTSEAKPPKQGS